MKNRTFPIGSSRPIRVEVSSSFYRDAHGSRAIEPVAIQKREKSSGLCQLEETQKEQTLGLVDIAKQNQDAPILWERGFEQRWVGHSSFPEWWW